MFNFNAIATQSERLPKYDDLLPPDEEDLMLLEIDEHFKQLTKYQSALTALDVAESLEDDYARCNLEFDQFNQTMSDVKSSLKDIDYPDIDQQFNPLEKDTLNDLHYGVEGFGKQVSEAIVWLWEKVKTIFLNLVRRFKVIWETSYGRTRKQMAAMEELIDRVSGTATNPNAGNVIVNSNMALYLRLNNKVESAVVMKELSKLAQLASAMYVFYPKHYEEVIKDVVDIAKDFEPGEDHTAATQTIYKYSGKSWCTKLLPGATHPHTAPDGDKSFATEPFLGDRVMHVTCPDDDGMPTGDNSLADVINRQFNKISVRIDDVGQTRLEGATVKSLTPNDIRSMLLTLKQLAETREKYSSNIQKHLSAPDKLKSTLDAMVKKHGNEKTTPNVRAIIGLLTKVTTECQKPINDFDNHVKKVIDVVIRFADENLKRHAPAGDNK